MYLTTSLTFCLHVQVHKWRRCITYGWCLWMSWICVNTSPTEKGELLNLNPKGYRQQCLNSRVHCLGWYSWLMTGSIPTQESNETLPLFVSSLPISTSQTWTHSYVWSSSMLFKPIHYAERGRPKNSVKMVPVTVEVTGVPSPPASPDNPPRRGRSPQTSKQVDMSFNILKQVEKLRPNSLFEICRTFKSAEGLFGLFLQDLVICISSK